MAYEKQNFEDGQVLKAENLNKMEDELAREKSWGELGDKPFLVANLNYETFALDMTPEEIFEVTRSGGTVLFAMTMTPISVDTDETGIYAVYASSIGMVVDNGEGLAIGSVLSFSPTDGGFMGGQTVMFTGGTVIE